MDTTVKVDAAGICFYKRWTDIHLSTSRRIGIHGRVPERISVFEAQRKLLELLVAIPDREKSKHSKPHRPLNQPKPLPPAYPHQSIETLGQTQRCSSRNSRRILLS